MKMSFLKLPLIFGFVVGLILPTLNNNVQAISKDDLPKLSGGYGHTLAYKYDGTAWSWGYNSYGQLGNGTVKMQYAMAPVSNLSDVSSISSGNYFSVASKKDGTVWGWGQNTYGKLGDGTTTTRKLPVQTKNLTDVKQVDAGDDFALALKNDGTVWGWGNDSYGVLGDNSTSYKKLPVQVKDLTDIITISAGNMHSLALKSDGTVWSWGMNATGQLGNGTKTGSKIPVQVSGLDHVVAISAGAYYSLAVKDDGTVWAWGQNSYGKLGDGTVTNRLSPIQVKNLSNVKDVSTGYYHSLALKNDGTVWAWGQNTYGALGDGTTTNRLTPVQVKNLDNVASIGTGFYHSMAVKKDGTVWGWGQNSYGKLGDGTAVTRKAPVQVLGLSIINPNQPIDQSQIQPIDSNPIDVTAPTTNSNILDDWQNTDFQVVLTAQDDESGVDSTYYSVNGSDYVKGNVFDVSQEGINEISFYSVDVAGNIEDPQTVELKIDQVEPVTTANVGSGIYNNDLSVQLSATDDESGINGTYYSIDGKAYTEGNTLTISNEGSHMLRYYSIDNAGNQEKTNVANIIMDKTAPVTMSNLDDHWYNKDIPVRLISFDAVTNVAQTFYSVDGSTYTEGSSFTVSGEGNHSVSYYSVDEAGNIENAKSETVKIDKTVPNTISNIEENWYTKDVSVQLSATDNLSGVAKTYYSIDGSVYTEGTNFTVSDEGIHKISFYSVDNAGNSEVPMNAMLKLDKTTPVTGTNLEDKWYNQDVQVQLTATDNGSKVAHTFYSIDGSAYTEGVNFTVSDEGVHTIHYYSVDNAGNIEDSQSATVKVDKTAPETQSNGGGDWHNQGVQIQLSATDNLSGVAKTYYSIDGSAYTEGTNFTVSDEGIHQISFYSVDNAGNKENVKTEVVKMDKTAPISTNNLIDQWYNKDVSVQLSATDNLSGVAKTYYSIDGSAYTEGTNFTVSDEGIHTIHYYSMDNAGNIEDTQSVTVKVDKTAPIVTWNIGGKYALGTKLPVQYQANDNLSGIANEILTVNGQVISNGTIITLDKSGTYDAKVVVTDNAGLTTTLEKEILVYIPADVKVEPNVLKGNHGLFTVKVTVPKEFKGQFDLSSVTLNGVHALSDTKGYNMMAEKGMFKFERSDFQLENGTVTLEFKGTLSSGETVIGYATVEVQSQPSIQTFFEDLVQEFIGNLQSITKGDESKKEIKPSINEKSMKK